MTTVQPTDAPREIDISTKELLGWLWSQTYECASPEALKPADRLEVLDTVWVIIQNKVGHYRDKSFALNADQQKEFREVEHYMKVLTALYGQKEG